VQTESNTGTLECYVPRMLLGRLATPSVGLVEVLEGTMVFADVSGFTRLSERLARKGTEGAEHLVDAINTCFSALLGIAYDLGGSLLKFGGDAMLLWFYDEGHALRACSAAIAMRRALRDVGRIRAGSSSVVLRMSVGVHTGSYAMFLVGGSHRELLVGGPATGTVVAMESAAAAGQILVSADTAGLLAPNCLGARRGAGVLLARAPAAPAWDPPPLASRPSDEAIANSLSTAVRA
jgi:class 3 adenylate cyclase